MARLRHQPLPLPPRAARAAAVLGMLLAALLAAATGASAQANFVYNATNSLCAPFLPAADYLVWGGLGNQTQLEDALASSLQKDAKAYLPIIPHDCYVQALRLTCLRTFMMPDPNATYYPRLPCAAVCQNTAASCRSFVLSISSTAGSSGSSSNANSTLAQVQQLLLPDCANQTLFDPAPTCLAPEYNAALVMQPACPAPLIKYPYANLSDAAPPRQVCVGQCCVTCPFSYNLFPIGVMRQDQAAQYTIHIVSFVLIMFLLVSFAVLPNKREFPSIAILNLSVGIAIYHFTPLLTVGHPDDVLCRDAITEAKQYDKPVCGLQAFALSFGTIASMCWFFAFVLNLHMAIVWHSELLKKYIRIIYGICWTIPVILVLIPLSSNGAGFDFGSFCFVDGFWRNAVIFYPLAVVIFMAFVLTLGTTAKILQITSRTELPVTEILAVHLRPFFFTLGYLLIFLFYWILDFTLNTRFNTDGTTLFSNWVQCIVADGQTQDQCYERNKDSLPALGLIIANDILGCIIGMWTFAFFGARFSILEEWRAFLFDRSTGDEEAGDEDDASIDLKDMFGPRSNSGAAAAGPVATVMGAARVRSSSRDGSVMSERDRSDNLYDSTSKRVNVLSEI